MKIHRRTFLKQGLTVLAAQAATTWSIDAFAETRPFFARNGLAIGLQLYTLGMAMSQDLEGTLRKVASIGFREVELAGFHGQEPSQLRAGADRAGLRISSIHIGIEKTPYGPGLNGDIPRIASQVHTLGARFVVLPIPFFRVEAGKPLPMSLDECMRTADFLNEKGAALQREDLRLGYHNHNVEFASVSGTTAFDVLMQQTDPKLVSFEMDAGWVRAAGIDPIELLKRYPGRFKLMHLKDLRGSTQTNYAFAMDSTEVGRGIIDWQRLLPAAYAAGVQHFFVEQEPPFANGEFAAVTESYRFLSSMR